MSEDVRTHRQNKGRRESVPTECGQTIHGRGKKTERIKCRFENTCRCTCMCDGDFMLQVGLIYVLHVLHIFFFFLYIYLLKTKNGTFI